MKIKLSKTQWEGIGKKAGWVKTADMASDKVNIGQLKQEIIQGVIKLYKQGVQPILAGILQNPNDQKWAGNQTRVHNVLYPIYTYMIALPKKYSYIVNDGAYARLCNALEAYFKATQGGTLNSISDPTLANNPRMQEMFKISLNAIKQVIDAFVSWEQSVNSWNSNQSTE